MLALGGRVLSRFIGGLMSTLGWVILIVVLLVVFGGFRFTRR